MVFGWSRPTSWMPTPHKRPAWTEKPPSTLPAWALKNCGQAQLPFTRMRRLAHTTTAILKASFTSSKGVPVCAGVSTWNSRQKLGRVTLFMFLRTCRTRRSMPAPPSCWSACCAAVMVRRLQSIWTLLRLKNPIRCSGLTPPIPTAARSGKTARQKFVR